MKVHALVVNAVSHDKAEAAAKQEGEAICHHMLMQEGGNSMHDSR